MFISIFVKVNLKPDDQIILRPELIRDYALVICDSRRILHIIDHRKVVTSLEQTTLTLLINQTCNELQVFVENMGRRSDMDDLSELRDQRKGLLAANAIELVRKTKTTTIKSKKKPILNWRVNFLDFSFEFVGRFSFSSAYIKWEIATNTSKSCSQQLNSRLPYLAYSRFQVNKRTNNGVYLLLDDFRKGLVLVNGRLVGKYSTEPLLTLFVPGEMLFDGENEIIVFDLGDGRDFGCSSLPAPSVYVSRYHVLSDGRILN